MCTTDIGGDLLDIKNNSQADRKPLKPGEKVRKSVRKVWEYDNTAIDCLNPCYSRYIYGYYHAGGPLATPNWEALREGIDDIRYVYQLEKLCKLKAAKNPDEVAKAERFLDEIRAKCDFDDRSIINEYGEWTPERFDLLRNQVIEWITKLEKL